MESLKGASDEETFELASLFSYRAEIQGFWRAYIEDAEIPAGRASGLQSHLTAIERALGCCHDDAPQMIEWKFGRR